MTPLRVNSRIPIPYPPRFRYPAALVFRRQQQARI
jgi:hypothetical protein